MRPLAIALLVAGLLGPFFTGGAARAQSAEVPTLDRAYSWPHDGPLGELFDPGDSPWGPGHRGIDIVVLPDDPVRAVADGVVTFAGAVAGTTWVTIEHQPGLLSTVGALAALAVATGDTVGRGQVIGTTTGRIHDDVAGIHVSFRWEQRYIDPLEVLPPRHARGPSLLGPGGWRAGDPSQTSTPNDQPAPAAAAASPFPSTPSRAAADAVSPLAAISSVGFLPPVPVRGINDSLRDTMTP
ncbi:MAG: M23 family metallopeptidase [Nitriliruptorales bacterium]|nr:M23 family metallopeptidase [Nitriliruptorales bacterium]